jgi:hypothetical protein
MPQIKNGGAFGFGFGRPSFARKKNQEGFFWRIYQGEKKIILRNVLVTKITCVELASNL